MTHVKDESPVTSEMIERGLAEYSEGGCMGLDQRERREVVTSIIEAALSHRSLGNADGVGVKAEISGPVPGHWASDEGAEMARTYAKKERADLAYGQKTDLELANAIFMVGRGDLDLIGLQTAAKERIRWLSVQLHLALSVPLRPDETERGEVPIGYTTQNMIEELKDPSTICCSIWPNNRGQAIVPLYTASPTPDGVVTDEQVERALSQWFGDDWPTMGGLARTGLHEDMRAALVAALQPSGSVTSRGDPAE